MVSMPSVPASARIARTSARLSGRASAPSPDTKLRSIFNTEIGNRCRYDSAEKPVPKSSSCARMPCWRSVRSMRSVRGASSSSATSVISSRNLAGSAPWASNIASRRSPKSGERKCRGDTFTEM